MVLWWGYLEFRLWLILKCCKMCSTKHKSCHGLDGLVVPTLLNSIGYYFGSPHRKDWGVYGWGPLMVKLDKKRWNLV